MTVNNKIQDRLTVNLSVRLKENDKWRELVHDAAKSLKENC